MFTTANAKPHKASALKVCTCFLLCGTIGWVYETIVESIARGQFAFRGFLFEGPALGGIFPFLKGTATANWPLAWGMPLILIYGIGGTIMCFLFQKLVHKPLILFFTGAASMSVVELAGSYLCEWLLGYQLWNYSYMPLNYQGRVSVVSAIVWGVLSIIAVRFVDPLLEKLYAREQTHRNAKAFVYTLTTWAAICTINKFFM